MQMNTKKELEETEKKTVVHWVCKERIYMQTIEKIRIEI